MSVVLLPGGGQIERGMGARDVKGSPAKQRTGTRYERRKEGQLVNSRSNQDQWSSLSAIAGSVAAVCTTWTRVLAAPRVSTFAGEIPEASWDRMGVGLGLIALAWMASDALRNHVEHAAGSGVFHAALALIASGVLFLLARTVGRGMGDFTTQTHLYLLYHAPLSCALAVVAMVPGAGGLVALILAPFATLYGAVLTYFMLQAAHRMSGRRAFLTLLTLFLIMLAIALLVILVLIVLLAAIGALLSHV